MICGLLCLLHNGFRSIFIILLFKYRDNTGILTDFHRRLIALLFQDIRNTFLQGFFILQLVNGSQCLLLRGIIAFGIRNNAGIAIDFLFLFLIDTVLQLAAIC